MTKKITEKAKKITKTPIKKEVSIFETVNFITSYFSISRLILLAIILFSLGFFVGIFSVQTKISADFVNTESNYWLLLNRKSNQEFLYKGVFGDKSKSELVRKFQVKVGVPGEKPTPLPELVGRKYWLVIDKFDAKDYPETAPYFLKLDVPVTDEEPYGPEPYLECSGQCNWILPGFFGLHGINGEWDRLSNENLGSSGCVRHRDEDITYLYNLLDPKTQEIRYYVSDN